MKCQKGVCALGESYSANRLLFTPQVKKSGSSWICESNYWNAIPKTWNVFILILFKLEYAPQIELLGLGLFLGHESNLKQAE